MVKKQAPWAFGLLAALLVMSCAQAQLGSPLEVTIDGVKIMGPYPEVVTQAELPPEHQEHRQNRACVNPETRDRIYGVLDLYGDYHPVVHVPYMPIPPINTFEDAHQREMDCGISETFNRYRAVWLNIEEKHSGGDLYDLKMKGVDVRWYVFHAESRHAVPVRSVARTIDTDGRGYDWRGILTGYRWEPIE